MIYLALKDTIFCGKPVKKGEKINTVCWNCIKDLVKNKEVCKLDQDIKKSHSKS